MSKVTPITTAEVADLAGVSVKTVTRWAASGALPPLHKLSGLRGAYLFDPRAVEKFRAQREAGAA